MTRVFVFVGFVFCKTGYVIIGERKAGQTWVDLTNSREDQITIEENGYATFPVNGGSVSVWARHHSKE